jgi:hypothetical protein
VSFLFPLLVPSIFLTVAYSNLAPGLCPIGLRFSSPRSSSRVATLFLAPGLCHIGLGFSSPRSASGFDTLSLAPGLSYWFGFPVPSIFLKVRYSVFGTWIGLWLWFLSSGLSFTSWFWSLDLIFYSHLGLSPHLLRFCFPSPHAYSFVTSLSSFISSFLLTRG